MGYINMCLLCLETYKKKKVKNFVKIKGVGLSAVPCAEEGEVSCRHSS